MDSGHMISTRRAQIIEQIAALGPMRMGSINEQLLLYKQKDGAIRRRGPYLTCTFKQGGKTCGRHLRNQEEADLYRHQIEAFRRYQELSTELVQVSQTLADLEDSGDEGCT